MNSFSPSEYSSLGQDTELRTVPSWARRRLFRFYIAFSLHLLQPNTENVAQ